MRTEHLEIKDTGLFKKTFIDYFYCSEKLESFFEFGRTVIGQSACIDAVKNSSYDRKTLQRVLSKQYKKVKPGKQCSSQIEKISGENTFFVITGHQLNIYTGPLFFIYKIASAIRYAKELNQRHPDKHFIPLYWMASEDHDKDEIDHFWFDNEKTQWKTSQSGAVGEFNLEGFEKTFERLNAVAKTLASPYLKSKTLSEATFKIVHNLFGDYGLLTLEPNHKALKSLFSQEIIKELTEQTGHTAISATNTSLKEQGYNPQVNGREINLFYMTKGLRERIKLENGRFNILNTDLSFSKDEIIEEINTHPEHFSPNVILRPLYQQKIFPCVAYFGGPAEVEYWLQLNGVFKAFEIVPPVIQPRLFGVYFDKANTIKIEKLGLSNVELFMDISNLQKSIAKKDYKLDELTKDRTLQKLEEVYVAKTKEIDPSLNQYIGKSFNQLAKLISHMDGKLAKAAKGKSKIKMNQLESIKEYAFPNGTPQERKNNILSIPGHQQFIEYLINSPQIQLDSFNIFYDE